MYNKHKLLAFFVDIIEIENHNLVAKNSLPELIETSIAGLIRLFVVTGRGNGWQMGSPEQGKQFVS